MRCLVVGLSVVAVCGCAEGGSSSPDARGAIDAGDVIDAPGAIDAPEAIDATPLVYDAALPDATPPDAMPDQLLTNAATCANLNSVLPLAGEESHYIAARLTPPSYPFSVTDVQYTLSSGGDCVPGLAHQVQVYATTTTTPPGTPVVHETIPVPTIATTMDRMVSLPLNAPLVLTAGEHLIIAIQNSGVSPNVTCVVTCDDVNAIADRNWWSNAGAPVFPWATLSSFGLDTTVMADAIGHPI
jgi:hypothetical protein